MEISGDYKEIFGNHSDYKSSSKTTTHKEVPDRISTNGEKTAVLCFRDANDQKEIPFGSCLICLAHVKDDIKEHVKKCVAKLSIATNCSICLSQLDDKHTYSNSHAVQHEKMRIIAEKHNSKIGVAKGGELVIDLKGANIIGQEYVYELATRLNNCKMPSPGGLAAFHLDAALVSATDNNSLSKNMAENSAIAQMLMQVSIAISNGLVPCVEAAKISYSLNGYSMIELIGALNAKYPNDYAFELSLEMCYVHDIKEKTIKFKTPLKSFNHLVGLLRIITGKEVKKLTQAQKAADKVITPPANGAVKRPSPQ